MGQQFKVGDRGGMNRSDRVMAESALQRARADLAKAGAA